MPHRFYCPELASLSAVTLEGTEAHHLAHVLRHQQGDLVQLFNGTGGVAECRVAQVRKRDVSLEVVSFRQDPFGPLTLVLATAVPKGERFDWLIEKATELGVSRLIPMLTERSIVDPRAGKLEKLRQTVVAACKQSGRNHLMEISAVTPWADVVTSYAAADRFIVADPQGVPLGNGVAPSVGQPFTIVIAIGPEGGFSDQENQAAAAIPAELVQLGPRILRIETAAIALSARFLI